MQISQNEYAAIARKYLALKKVHRFHMKKVETMADIEVQRVCHWWYTEHGLEKEYREFEEKQLTIWHGETIDLNAVYAETLFVLAVMYCAGFHIYDRFNDAIRSADETIIEALGVNCVDSIKNTALHLLNVMEKGEYNRYSFCVILMHELEMMYHQLDLIAFTQGVYSLWLLLPNSINTEKPYCYFAIMGEYDGIYLSEQECRKQIDEFLSWK